VNTLLIGSHNKTKFFLDFLQNDFENFLLIDPTGEVAKAAANCLPASLTQQALYLDPSDMAHVVGINVVEGVLKDNQQLLTEQICAYFFTMFPAGENTLARTNAAPILAASLRLLLETPGSTLLNLLDILKDNTLQQSSDPIVRDTLADITTKDYATAVAFLRSNFRTLLMSPTVRNILGQKKSTLGEASIIIANLDRAKLGDTTAKLLGGLLIARSSGPVYITDYGYFASLCP